MEGPELSGPSVWVELNKKNGDKIVAFITKNQERTAWLAQYLAECKRKMGAACPEPTFVPKTPAKPAARGKGRTRKASMANNTLSSTVEETAVVASNVAAETEPARGRGGRRVTRQSRMVVESSPPRRTTRQSTMSAPAQKVADTTAADESSEVIEATRVEKEGQSPRTPPPRLASTHAGKTATIATGGEERMKRAAEEEDPPQAPLSKAARNAETAASPIPKPRTKLAGKVIATKGAEAEEVRNENEEVGSRQNNMDRVCVDVNGGGQDDVAESVEDEVQVGNQDAANSGESSVDMETEVESTPIPEAGTKGSDGAQNDETVVLETNLEDSVAVVPLEKTMEVPISVDSTTSSSVIEVEEEIKGKGKAGRGKKAAHKQEDADVSTASEDEESGRGKRPRKKKKGKETEVEVENKNEGDANKENVEMLPPSPKAATGKTRGARKRKVNDSSNLSNVSSASHESSIEHLSVSQNLSTREEEQLVNQSKTQESKAEKRKRLAEEKRVQAEGEERKAAEEEKRKAAEEEEEKRKLEEEKQKSEVAEAKTRSTRTKTIQKLLQELEPPANIPSPRKEPRLSSSDLVETASGRSTRTRQRHQTPTEELPRSTRSKQIPLHSSTTNLHTVPSTASPRVRELAAAVSCSSLPRSSSPSRVPKDASSSPVLARVQAFETAMRAQAGLKPASDPQPSRSTRTRQRQRSATVEEPSTKTTAEDAANIISQEMSDSPSTPQPCPKDDKVAQDEESTSSEPPLTAGQVTPPPRPAEERRSRTTTKRTPPPRSAAERRSSLGDRLKRVSTSRGVTVAELVSEQEVVITSPPRRGPTIRKSPSSAAPSHNTSRAPAGKVVRPMRKVLASGGRVVNTPSSASSHSGSSSAKLMKSRSRLDIPGARKEGGPSNMISKGGITSFLPAKPKQPTLAEIQEQKLEEIRKKEEKELEAKARREEMMKAKAEEQKLKREERIRRVQEARQKQEDQQASKLRRNQEKEKEEKLAHLKKREEMQKAEAKRRKEENDLKLREAEERRQRDESERVAKQDRLEAERREEEKRREAEKKKELEDYRKLMKAREEEERRKRAEDEKRKAKEEQKREEEDRQMREEKMRLEEEKKKAAAHSERIIREREELKKIKEREAARAAEAAKPAADLNTTYEKPSSAKPSNKALDRTVNMDQQQPQSYDMTPARHELPPEPLRDEDNYGLEDLDSDAGTDDEDCPRKQVPKWAEGTNLRTALLKQCYMPPDLDQIFATVEMPDLSSMFVEQRKRFFKRTSSACWEQPPESFKHGPRRA